MEANSDCNTLSMELKFNYCAHKKKYRIIKDGTFLLKKKLNLH